ncbi:protein SSUH2 homolog [Dendropsophus ebraccatus]|uniref:protein SSUH2 homolog n=1 Tax=Dendropsophus ebraccatus TaxID=150705 RepID=UPI003831E094
MTGSVLTGSELHPAGSPASISDITFKDENPEGNDCPKCEDFTHGSAESYALGVPVSVITLTDEDCQVNEYLKYEDLTHVHAVDITFKDDESQGTDRPKYEDLMQAPVEVTIPTSLISEDVARQALLEYARKKCYYSTGPAQQMLLQDLQPFSTFRYRLDTFTEIRICKWVSDPYYGEEVDGPDNGPPPNPWDLQANPPNLFQKAEYYIPLPHTSSVEICSQCGGLGRNICISCFGTGRSRCMYCGGAGWSGNQRCFSCGGMGRQWCMGCSGSGYQRCITCSAKGRLLKYIQLTVKWKNHNFEFIADHKSDFPTKRFKKVTGDIIFSDEQQMVSPIVNSPEPSINEASENVISKHRSEFALSKILRQRHSIEWLPLTKVNFTWNGAEYYYFVYGKENKAYATKYPIKCCCTII